MVREYGSMVLNVTLMDSSDTRKFDVVAPVVPSAASTSDEIADVTTGGSDKCGSC